VFWWAVEGEISASNVFIFWDTKSVVPVKNKKQAVKKISKFFMLKILLKKIF
jgi:hypothetical protein